jgi:hypothetical protein
MNEILTAGFNWPGEPAWARMRTKSHGCSRADRSSVGLLLCPTFPLPGSLETGTINPSAAPRRYYTPA